MNIFDLGDKNPNFLGSVDLIGLKPSRLVLTIQKIYEDKVVGERGEQNCTICSFKENYKPMILNPTNKKMLCRLFGTKEIEQMAGKKIIVEVRQEKAFGKIMDCLRIKDELPRDVVYKCEECGNVIAPFGTMTAEQVFDRTKKTYGKALCSACATKAKEAKNETAADQ